MPLAPRCDAVTRTHVGEMKSKKEKLKDCAMLYVAANDTRGLGWSVRRCLEEMRLDPKENSNVLNRVKGVRMAGYDFEQIPWIQNLLESSERAADAGNDVNSTVRRAAKRYVLERKANNNSYTITQAAADEGLDVSAPRGRYNANVQRVRREVAKFGPDGERRKPAKNGRKRKETDERAGDTVRNDEQARDEETTPLYVAWENDEEKEERANAAATAETRRITRSASIDVAVRVGGAVAIMEGANAAAAAKRIAEKTAFDETNKKRLRAADLYVSTVQKELRLAREALEVAKAEAKALAARLRDAEDAQCAAVERERELREALLERGAGGGDNDHAIVGGDGKAMETEAANDAVASAGSSEASPASGSDAERHSSDEETVRQGVNRQAQTNDQHRALGDEFLDAESYSAAVEQFRRVKSAISQTLRNNAQAVKMPARRMHVECMLKVAHCFGMLKMSKNAQSELSEVLRDSAHLLEVDKESPTMVAFTGKVERFWRAVSLRSINSYASTKNGAAKNFLNQALYAMADFKTEDTPAIVNRRTGGMGVNGSSAVPLTAGGGAQGDEAKKKQKKIRCPLCKTKYVLQVKVGSANINDIVKFTCTKAGCNSLLKYSLAEK